MDDKDLALAELKMLQDIIARQDGFKDKTKTLTIALFSAVSAGYFSGQITLSAWQYFFASFGICIVFMTLEGAYGATEINAEHRVDEVEAFLRGTEGSVYAGPAIREALLRPGSLLQVIESILRWRTLFLYLCLLILSAVGASFVPPSKKTDEKDIKDQLSMMVGTLNQLESDAKNFNQGLTAISDSLKTEKANAPTKKKK